MTHIPHASGPIQLARGDVGLMPFAAARPEKVPALICDTYARRIVCVSTIWGCCFALASNITPPNIWGTNLKFLT